MQSDGQIQRQRRFSHATLAGPDRDDILDLWQRTRLRRGRAARFRGEFDMHDAGANSAHGRGHVTLDHLAQGTSRGREFDMNGDAVSVDANVLNHVQGNNVP